MGDILFNTLEKFNAGRPWGRFLDAGTGLHSIKWIQKLPTDSWTAITADNNMSASMMRDESVAKSIRACDSLVVGNWMNDHFCATLGKFDTILADYLIGAVDGFSPYEQDTIIRRLKNHLNPGGRLYFIGMNPIPDDPNPSAMIITEIRQARDACILLAGHRPYREFPLQWTKRHMEAAQFYVIDTKKFTILHSEESALRQVRVARSKLDFMKNAALKAGMEKYLNDLEYRTREIIKAQGGRIPLSFDYVMNIQHAEEYVPTEGVSIFQFANSVALNNNNNSSSSSGSENAVANVATAGVSATPVTTATNAAASDV